MGLTTKQNEQLIFKAFQYDTQPEKKTTTNEQFETQ